MPSEEKKPRFFGLRRVWTALILRSLFPGTCGFSALTLPLVLKNLFHYFTAYTAPSHIIGASCIRVECPQCFAWNTLTYLFCQSCGTPRHSPVQPVPPSQEVDIPTLESSRLELEHRLRSSKYERTKSHLEVEFVRFLAQLHPPKDFSTLTPRDIVHFLIWKDKDAKTQVHKDGRPQFGSSPKVTKGCKCPKRLAFKTVDSLIGQIGALLLLSIPR